MDFRPEDIGPYDPDMTFSLENVGRTTQMQPSEEKSDENVQISKLSRQSRNLKNAPSTISDSPICLPPTYLLPLEIFNIFTTAYR